METSHPPTPGSEAWAERIVASLHAERDGVRKFLAAQQTRLERAETTLEELVAGLEAAVESPRTEGKDDAGDLDYQRRYEMALDDLRELKTSNATLQEELAKARAMASTSAKQRPTRQGGLDWETEKLRILASLESDLNENDSEQRAERSKIEDALRTTEEVIAEKDNEIQELKRQLEESAAGIGLKDEKAAAVDQAIQNDAIVQEEREKLRQLEEQWQNRLCQAEIEISLERAKLARERAEFEERMRSAGADRAKSTSGAADRAEPPARGRWMSRLGLTDADRERERRR